MLFAKEHHDNQRGCSLPGKSLATKYFEDNVDLKGDTPEVLKQQAWLPEFPGLQEYLAPPWWLSRLTEPDVPMVQPQQIWIAGSERLDVHHLGWPARPRANPDGKDELTQKGISSFMDPQKIQTCLSWASLERPPLEGPPGFPLKVKERQQGRQQVAARRQQETDHQAWSCPLPWERWGLAEDFGTKKEPTPKQAQSVNARSCPFPGTSEPSQAKAKAADMRAVARSQPLPTGRVVREADGDQFFPEVVTGESTAETSLMLTSENTEEIKSKVVTEDLKGPGNAQASRRTPRTPRTQSTNTPREGRHCHRKNKRAKKRGHDSQNSVVEYVFQPDHHLLEEFELVPKGIDRGGKKTKTIAERCKGKARFRGKGSRYFEHNNREAPIPLRLCVSCPPENFKEGQEEAKKLLAELQKDFVTKCGERQKWPRRGCKTLYTEYIRAPAPGAPGSPGKAGKAVWIRTDGPPLALER